MTDSRQYFVSTTTGLEPILCQELQRLGLKRVRRSSAGAFFEGDLQDVMRANLWLRTAQRVMLPLLEFECPDFDTLYRTALTLPWESHLLPEGTFAVDASLHRSALTHSHFAALRVKDAIVDRLRQRTGRRPDVDPQTPLLRVALNIRDRRAQLLVDFTGDPLFMRRYRVRQTEAPLKETLAAGILALSDWSPSRPLLDPLCGSGTLAIEAALTALCRAPGRQRDFAFQTHPSFDDAAQADWQRLLEEADARALSSLPAPIRASDRDLEAVTAARANARAAGVADQIEIVQADVRELEVADGDHGRHPTVWISNLPYGTRIGGSSASVEAFYRQLGGRLRTLNPHSAWLLTSHPRFESLVGMAALARHKLYNGPIETWLYGLASRKRERRR